MSLINIIQILANDGEAKSEINELYFFAGDSYMRGNSPNNLIADLPAKYQGTFPKVKVWTGSSFDTLDTTINNNQFPLDQKNLAFAYHMIFGIERAIASGKTVYLCTHGVGGSELAQTVEKEDWNYLTVGELFDIYKTQLTTSLSWLSTNNISYQMKSLSINLGLNDTRSGYFNEIEANIYELSTLLRTHIGVSSLPMYLNRFPIIPSMVIGEANIGRAGIEAAAASITNCKWIDLDNYEISTDEIHLSVNGTIDLALGVLNVIDSSLDAFTFGRTTILGTTVGTTDRRAVQYTVPQDGILNSISVYHLGSSIRNIIVGVYDDAIDHPEARLAVSNSTPTDATSGWQAVDLITPIAITTGQELWLAVVPDGNLNLKYQSGTGIRRAEGDITYSLDDPFGNHTVAISEYSIFANCIG